MNSSASKDSRDVLIEVARSLSSSQNIDELLSEMIERSRDVMRCEICSILIPDENSNDLVVRSNATINNDAKPIRIPAGRGISGYAFENKKTVNSTDVQSDKRHFQLDDAEETTAMLTSPLMDGDTCVGVIQAINPTDRRHFSEDDQNTFETFASLIAVTLVRMNNEKRAIKNAEIQREMELSHEIQETFLPPKQQEFGTIAIEALYQPASHVSGDFYFWHALPNGRILTGIGDVCGKGFPAALDMARTTTLITTQAHREEQPNLGVWVTELNAELCKVMKQGRFIAGTFMLIDPNERWISFCPTGTPSPKMLEMDQGWSELNLTLHPPLGIAPNLRYTSDRISMASGQAWLIYSDGILELQNKRGEQFGDFAFDKALSNCSNPLKNNILSGLQKAQSEFTEKPSYQDDTTLLLVRDLKITPTKQRQCICSPKEIGDFRAFVQLWTDHSGIDDRTAGLMILGCDEVLTNIYRHAYGNEAGQVCCEIEASPKSFFVTFSHNGKGQLPENIKVEPPKEGQIGGMGQYVIHQIFDEVTYLSNDEESQVILKKDFEFDIHQNAEITPASL